MFAVNPYDIWTAYTKQEYQVFRQRSVDGEPPTVIWASHENLLPFQIRWASNLADPVSFKLYDEDGNEIHDIDVSLITKEITTGGVYFYTYDATSSIGIQLDCGQRFYAVVRFIPQTFYFDLVEAIDINNPDILGGSGTID